MHWVKNGVYERKAKRYQKALKMHAKIQEVVRQVCEFSLLSSPCFQAHASAADSCFANIISVVILRTARHKSVAHHNPLVVIIVQNESLHHGVEASFKTPCQA